MDRSKKCCSQPAPKEKRASGLYWSGGRSSPSLVTRSSAGSPFILPSRPSVSPENSSGSSTVTARAPPQSRASTPAPDGNMTVMFCGIGENTNTPVGGKGGGGQRRTKYNIKASRHHNWKSTSSFNKTPHPSPGSPGLEA